MHGCLCDYCGSLEARGISGAFRTRCAFASSLKFGSQCPGEPVSVRSPHPNALFLGIRTHREVESCLCCAGDAARPERGALEEFHLRESGNIRRISERKRENAV